MSWTWFGLAFGSHIGSKFDKNKIPQIIHQTQGFDARGVPTSMPKLINNQCQLAILFYGNNQAMFFGMVKSCKFVVNTTVFDSLPGCVRERKRYQKPIKNDPQIHLKSMKNQC